MSSSPSPTPSGETPAGGVSPRGASPKAQGRKKIPIDRIMDDRSRYVTFYKRKGGLIKKAMELSVLCDCEISLIIFNSAGKMFDYSSHNMEKTIQRYLDSRHKPHKSLHNRDYDKTFGRKNSKSPDRSNSIESRDESRELNPSDEDDFYEEMNSSGKRPFDDDDDDAFGEDAAPRSPGKKQNLNQGSNFNAVLPSNPHPLVAQPLEQQWGGFGGQQQQRQQAGALGGQFAQPYPNMNMDMGFLNQTPLFSSNQRSLSQPLTQQFQQQMQMQQQYHMAQLQAQQQQQHLEQQLHGQLAGYGDGHGGGDGGGGGPSNLIVTGENWDQVTGKESTSPKHERPILVVSPQQVKRRGSRDEGQGGTGDRRAVDMLHDGYE